MSALPPKPDMCGALVDVCYGPKADIAYSNRRKSLARNDWGREDATRDTLHLWLLYNIVDLEEKYVKRSSEADRLST
jgi:hypothetical protein